MTAWRVKMIALWLKHTSMTSYVELIKEKFYEESFTKFTKLLQYLLPGNFTRLKYLIKVITNAVSRPNQRTCWWAACQLRKMSVSLLVLVPVQYWNISIWHLILRWGGTRKFSSIDSAIWLTAGVAGAGDGEGVGQFNDDARSLNTFLISDIRDRIGSSLWSSFLADYFGFLGVGLGTGSVFWFGVVVADVLLAVDVGRGKRSMSSELVIGTEVAASLSRLVSVLQKNVNIHISIHLYSKHFS